MLEFDDAEVTERTISSGPAPEDSVIRTADRSAIETPDFPDDSLPDGPPTETEAYPNSAEKPTPTIDARVVNVALSAAGDVCASISEHGDVVSWDLIEKGPIAVARLPDRLRAVNLFYTANDEYLCVVGRRGYIVFFEPRTLEPIGGFDTRTADVVWSCPSNRNDTGALLITQEEVVLVDANQGVGTRVGVELGERIVTAGRNDSESWSLYFNEGAELLRIVESTKSRGKLKATFEELSPRIVDGGNVIDVSPLGSLLTLKDGVFFEIPRAEDEIRKLNQPSDREWSAAFWLAREASFAALSKGGELFITKRGDQPVNLDTGVCAIAVNRDRTRLVSFDESGKLRTWQPAQAPLASAAVVSRGGGPSSVADLWDISDIDGRIVYATKHRKKYTIQVQNAKTGSAEMNHRLGTGGLLDVRWADTGDALGVLEKNGIVTVLRVDGKPGPTIDADEPDPTHIALFDGARGVCVAHATGTVICRSVTGRANKVALRWTRQVERQVSSIGVSTVAGRLAVGCMDGSVVVFDVQTGAELLSLPNTFGPVQDFAFSNDGHMFAMLRPAGVVEVYDSYAGRLAYRQRMREETVARIVMRADGQLMAVEREGPTVRAFAVDTGDVTDTYALLAAGG